MSQNTRFYKFSDNSSYKREFTRAISIRPRSEIVRRVCPELGAVSQYPSKEFDVVVEGGSYYPDILGCDAYPFLIVSEAVVTAWGDAGITSFQPYLVCVAEARSKSKKLHETVPPRYFRIEIDGQCEIDMMASGLEVIHFAPECGYLVTNPSLPTMFIMKPGSWDGSPVFRDILHYPRVSFCTQLVLDIAHKHRFTNFRFELMEGPLDSWSRGIDYL